MRNLALKLFLFPVLLVFSCLVAGTYGGLHNQVSYTVSPDYFHAFRFLQFGFSPEWHTRLGASVVGVMASWWMGLMIGTPIAAIGLLAPKPSDFARGFVKATLIVITVATVFSLGALIYGYMVFSGDNIAIWALTWEGVGDRVAFARAGNMHNMTYLGGGAGLIVGSIYMFVYARRPRT